MTATEVMSCRVLLDGTNQVQNFRRSSVQAAMVNPAPALAPPAHADEPIIPEGPPRAVMVT